MKPEAQRIEIAEACGWEVRRTTNGEVCQSWQGWRTQDEDEQSQPVPNYLSDLNAMHETEKMLFDLNLWDEYESHLNKVCEVFTLYPHRHLIHATAAQRAEAFLKTLNLWI